MLRIVSVGISWILFIIAADGQDFRPGYTVTLKQDTVHGLVLYRTNRKNEKSCHFKETPKGEVVRYSPDQLRGYGFTDNKQFESIRFPAGKDSSSVTQFAEVLVKGKMNLYRQNNEYYIETERLQKLPRKKDNYVSNENGQARLPDGRLAGTFNYFLKDCNKKIISLNYNERDITDAVEQYNLCKGSPGLVTKRNIPWIRTNFQLFAGYDWSSLPYYGNHFVASSPLVGFGFDFSAPHFSDKLFISLEAIYLSKHINDVILTTSVNHTNVSIDVAMVKLPMAVRFNLSQDANTSYFKLGVVRLMTLNSSEVQTTIENNGTVLSTETSKSGLTRTFPLSYYAGIGYSKGLGTKIKGFVEIRYEFVEMQNYSSASLTLIGGLRF